MERLGLDIFLVFDNLNSKFLAIGIISSKGFIDGEIFLNSLKTSFSLLKVFLLSSQIPDLLSKEQFWKKNKINTAKKNFILYSKITSSAIDFRFEFFSISFFKISIPFFFF